MDNPTFIFLALVNNRVTEAVKRALVNQFPGLKDETVSLLVLLISFVIGAAGVILLFPSANIFAGQGVSTFAEMVSTGIVIGGLANGLDFVGGKLGDLLDKVTGSQTAKTTLEISEKKTLTPAA